ncbi:MAG: hypothetical protein SFY96_06700 [Planctomycetota bacterium]|nr:hypothetical protein [Planctomycetota bacterium]
MNTSSACVPAIAEATSFPELLGGMLSALADVGSLLRSIDDRVFLDTSLDPCFGASVGGHVRHVLDHARALSDAATHGRAAYEQRDRGSVLEKDRAVALEAVASVVERLRSLADVGGTRQIAVEVMPAPGRPIQLVTSTIERETAFVMSHTIHHIAIMRQLVARAGKDRCPQIGLAPGTPRADDGNAPCAH